MGMSDHLGTTGERISMVTVIASVALIILRSFDDIAHNYGSTLEAGELALGFFFVGEYITRVGLTQRKGKSWSGFWEYQGSFFGIIDLVSIIPVLLPASATLGMVKSLRLFRLLRVLKLARYSRSLQQLGRVIHAVRSPLITTLFMTLLIMVITSIFMYQIEHEAQPEAFPDVPSTFWWAIVTLTTVGYGDIYPVTALGKLFSGILSLVGVGIVAIPTGIISAAYMNDMNKGGHEE